MITNYKGYVIDSDKYQFILKKPIVRTKENGEKYNDEEYLGYYGTIDQAICGMQRKMMYDKVATEDLSLMEALEYNRQIWEDIKKELEGKK